MEDGGQKLVLGYDCHTVLNFGSTGLFRRGLNLVLPGEGWKPAIQGEIAKRGQPE